MNFEFAKNGWEDFSIGLTNSKNQFIPNRFCLSSAIFLYFSFASFLKKLLLQEKRSMIRF
jgi:hypothetical protein